ncbi:hypothetical protein [Calothrix sp. CCY 0018]|uniref:hypothetical protein n=1 Tax=Calothrix sp. CCY 0018 TaxID=3103864 RepID=UPI0039C706A1
MKQRKKVLPIRAATYYLIRLDELLGCEVATITHLNAAIKLLQRKEEVFGINFAINFN